MSLWKRNTGAVMILVLPAIGITITHFFFHVESRYSLPAWAGLWPLAGVGLMALIPSEVRDASLARKSDAAVA